jgi:hypothetical protein
VRQIVRLRDLLGKDVWGICQDLPSGSSRGGRGVRSGTCARAQVRRSWAAVSHSLEQELRERHSTTSVVLLNARTATGEDMARADRLHGRTERLRTALRTVGG